MRAIHHRCRLTGRHWLMLGPLSIGFGPKRFIERVKLGKRLLVPRIRGKAT